MASAVVAQLSSTSLTSNELLRPGDRGRTFTRCRPIASPCSFMPSSRSGQQVAAADAGVAAARLHERKARLVASRPEVIVAAIHATAHDSRAAAGRHSQAVVAETSNRLLHRDVEPLGDPADLLP